MTPKLAAPIQHALALLECGRTGAAAAVLRLLLLAHGHEPGLPYDHQPPPLTPPPPRLPPPGHAA